jgi:hypothetical protein
MQTARVVYRDDGDRILATRDVGFTSRPDLLRRIERDLDHVWAIEVWQGDDCVLCLKAHGAIEPRCGKPAPPAGPGCCG